MDENFKKWDKKTDDGNSTHYGKQSDIIKKVLETENHSLNELIELMRSQDESAIYFSGTRLDNSIGFGSNDIGTAISVLPEDGDKAAEPGHHPGSTEVYIIFQGSLVIEILNQGHLESRNCGQFDVLVIPPGQCHRVRYEKERKASSFIVKTNPHHNPKAVRCKECKIYSDISQCHLKRNWNYDEEIINKKE